MMRHNRPATLQRRSVDRESVAKHPIFGCRFVLHIGAAMRPADRQTASVQHRCLSPEKYEYAGILEKENPALDGLLHPCTIR